MVDKKERSKKDLKGDQHHPFKGKEDIKSSDKAQVIAISTCPAGENSLMINYASVIFCLVSADKVVKPSEDKRLNVAVNDVISSTTANKMVKSTKNPKGDHRPLPVERTPRADTKANDRTQITSTTSRESSARKESTARTGHQATLSQGVIIRLHIFASRT